MEHEIAGVRERAGVADVSWLAKLDLKGVQGNVAPAPGEAVRCWHLGVGHYIVTCEPGKREQVIASVTAPAYCTDVTSVYAALLVAGPRSRFVLRKLTSLNVSEAALPDGGCGQTGLAHIHAIVLRRDLDGLPAFMVLVSREYAESVWEALLEAGREFDIQPFGLEALRQLKF
jgi:heterotetrameric sarcosine oxidase gamma subunit